MTETAILALTLNGKQAAVRAGTTVELLLRERGLRSDRVAVEINGAIVAKADYAARALQASDVVEIVSFVGGG